MPDERTALVASGGALLPVTRAVLDGRAPKNADVHYAEGVLRVFGLTAADAAEVARRPLPAAPEKSELASKMPGLTNDHLSQARPGTPPAGAAPVVRAAEPPGC